MRFQNKKHNSFDLKFIKMLLFQSTILDYTTNLRKEGVTYLLEKWGTKTLEIPEAMVAPNIQIIYLPHIPGYTDKLVCIFTY